MFKFTYNKIINIDPFDIRTGSFGVIAETDAVKVTMSSLDELNKLIFSYGKAARQRLRVMILNSIKFDDADEGKIIIENIMSQALADLNSPGFAIIHESAVACAFRHDYNDAEDLSYAIQPTAFSLAAFFAKDKSKNIDDTLEKEPRRCSM